MSLPTREEVFQIINAEREYQERRWGFVSPSGKLVPVSHSVGDYIVLMDNYLAEAKRAFAKNHGDTAALNELRKVVALGVACFEQNGLPDRAVGTLITNARTGTLVPAS
jgi:hypothetical protein